MDDVLSRAEIAELLGRHPRPLVVQSAPGNGDSSALSTLVMAQVLPSMMKEQEDNRVRPVNDGGRDDGELGQSDAAEEALQSMLTTNPQRARRRKKK